MIPTHSFPPDAACATARTALATGAFDETLLRAWFTETEAGRIDPIPGGFRLTAHDVTFHGQGSFPAALASWARFVLGVDQDAPEAIAAMLELMAGRDEAAQLAMFEAAVIATGGTWVSPAPTGDWPASHLFEVSLLSVLGRGETPASALRDWIKAASRMVRRDAA